jgi:hypothetical protein
VEVDRRVELTAALHVLASEAGPLEGFEYNTQPYAQALKLRLHGHEDHPAVAVYRRDFLKATAEKRKAYVVLLNEIVNCLDAESLSVGPQQHCAENPLPALAADFARETGFARFLEQQRPSLAEYERQVWPPGRYDDPMRVFDRYTGVQLPVREKIAPSPLLQPDHNWIRNASPDVPGDRLMLVVSPRLLNGKLAFDDGETADTLWHARLHVVLDDLQTRYVSRIRATSALYEPGIYDSWSHALHENIVQAAVRRLGETEASARMPAIIIPYRPKLPYEKDAVERLKEYESSRDRYPTLRDFYPRLLDVFDEALRDSGKKP